MERQKKRLVSSLTALSDDVSGVQNEISRLELHARDAVDAAATESDPYRFAQLHDLAKMEIEKVKLIRAYEPF